MINKIAVSILFLLLSFQGVCQESSYKMYLDENNNAIDFMTYAKKSIAFTSLKEEKKIDTITVFKISKQFLFGKLSNLEKKQFQNLLKSNINKQIDTTKILLISNRKNLLGYEARKKLQKEHFTKDTLNRHFIKLTKTKFKSNQKIFDNIQKKCFKNFSKQNVQSFITYQVNNNYNYKPKHFDWIKTGINFNTIFKNNRLYNAYTLIVLKPNGEYFLSNKQVPSEILFKILNDQTWETSKSQLKASLESNSKTGIGVFKEFHDLLARRYSKKFMIVKDPERRKNLSNNYRLRAEKTTIVGSYSEMLTHLNFINFCFSNEH